MRCVAVDCRRVGTVGGRSSLGASVVGGKTRGTIWGRQRECRRDGVSDPAASCAVAQLAYGLLGDADRSEVTDEPLACRALDEEADRRCRRGDPSCRALAATTLIARCRSGSVAPADLAGGTFTANNHGAFGTDDGNPIINHPEAGILALGAARMRPWVQDGELAVRRVLRLTLAFDHRVSDGAEAGQFVTYLGDLCEQPARILLHP